MSTHTTSLRRRRRTGLAVVLIVLGTLLAASGVGPLGARASAVGNSNTGVSVESIDDYVDYPDPAVLPDGCTATSVLEGLQFAVDGGAGPASTLAALGDLPFGATVVMTWTGWVDGCETVISLGVKRSAFPDFQVNDNQELMDFVSCGADGAGCTVDGGFRLELTMPSFETGGCNYQVDAVVGAPLDVVGPSGSFYSNWLRAQFPDDMNESGDNMLISANNGRSVCEPPTTTTTEATTSTTEATTSTTAATTTSTTDPTTTTTAVESTTLTQPSSSTTGATVLGVQVTRPLATSLPRTGSDGDGPRTALGMGLLIAGVGLVLLNRDRTPPVRQRPGA